jgi:hypothetical protein
MTESPNGIVSNPENSFPSHAATVPVREAVLSAVMSRGQQLVCDFHTTSEQIAGNGVLNRRSTLQRASALHRIEPWKASRVTRD